MNSYLANRQAMHVTALAVLKSPEHYAVWQTGPAVFRQKVELLEEQVTGLGAFIRSQESALDGHAVAKARQGDELEILVHELSKTLVVYLRDQEREQEAAPIDLSFHHWQRLRADSMIEKARLALAMLSKAVTEDAIGAANYGLREDEVAELQSSITDYHDVIHAPQVAISSRKALTQALQPRFQAVSTLLQDIDHLVLRFRSTPAGQHFIDTWKNARRIRHFGVGQGATAAAASAGAPAH